MSLHQDWCRQVWEPAVHAAQQPHAERLLSSTIKLFFEEEIFKRVRRWIIKLKSVKIVKGFLLEAEFWWCFYLYKSTPPPKKKVLLLIGLCPNEADRWRWAFFRATILNSSCDLAWAHVEVYPGSEESRPIKLGSKTSSVSDLRAMFAVAAVAMTIFQRSRILRCGYSIRARLINKALLWQQDQQLQKGLSLHLFPTAVLLFIISKSQNVRAWNSPQRGWSRRKRTRKKNKKKRNVSRLARIERSGLILNVIRGDPVSECDVTPLRCCQHW